MDALLKVENLKKHFPVRAGFFRKKHDVVRAVDGLSFEIGRGETFGLAGESGCGKSTAGRLILRLIEPTEGGIWFQGQDITGFNRKSMQPLRKSMQIIFQDPYSSLNPRMMVKDIIGEGLKRNVHLPPGERHERVLSIMEKVGLRPEHRNRYPHEFSGGQRQRIAIARTIILDPEFVVADEPLSALDVSIQAQIVNLLEKLKDELRLSYLVISHDLSVLEHMSDRMAIMYLGKIMELAPRDQMYDNPRHPYTIALLSAIPLPKIQPKRDRIILRGDIPSPIHPPQGCRFHTRCPRAMAVCKEMEPEWKQIGEAHFTSCHLY